MKTFTQGAKSSAIFRSCSASKGGALVAVFLGLSLVGVCWEPPSILGPCSAGQTLQSNACNTIQGLGLRVWGLPAPQS